MHMHRQVLTALVPDSAGSRRLDGACVWRVMEFGSTTQGASLRVASDLPAERLIRESGLTAAFRRPARRTGCKARLPCWSTARAADRNRSRQARPLIGEHSGAAPRCTPAERVMKRTLSVGKVVISDPDAAFDRRSACDSTVVHAASSFCGVGGHDGAPRRRNSRRRRCRGTDARMRVRERTKWHECARDDDVVDVAARPGEERWYSLRGAAETERSFGASWAAGRAACQDCAPMLCISPGRERFPERPSRI